jgi:hypothetical protein
VAQKNTDSHLQQTTHNREKSFLSNESFLRTVAVPGEWSIVLPLHYSCTVAACPHALQALTTLPVCMSCKPIMALMAGALETCTRMHWKHACQAAQAGLLGFSLCLRPVAHRKPQDMWQRRSSPQQGGKVQSYRTRGSVKAHLSREVRSGAIGHVAALEPTSAGR